MHHHFISVVKTELWLNWGKKICVIPRRFLWLIKIKKISCHQRINRLTKRGILEKEFLVLSYGHFCKRCLGYVYKGSKTGMSSMFLYRTTLFSECFAHENHPTFLKSLGHRSRAQVILILSNGLESNILRWPVFCGTKLKCPEVRVSDLGTFSSILTFLVF